MGSSYSLHVDGSPSLFHPSQDQGLSSASLHPWLSTLYRGAKGGSVSSQNTHGVLLVSSLAEHCSKKNLDCKEKLRIKSQTRDQIYFVTLDVALYVSL